MRSRHEGGSRLERILGILFVVYLIFSFVSALTKKQQRPDFEDPGDDAPWPHLEGIDDPATGNAPRAETLDDQTGPTGWPTRPDPRGPGPIWTDLFGDPRRMGSPKGWPTRVPSFPSEDAEKRVPELALERVETTDRGPTTADRTRQVHSPTVALSDVDRLEAEFTESSLTSDAPRRLSSSAQETSQRQKGKRPQFELTAESLREAILYTEVLGPPRAMRPYRPPHWKL